MESPWPWRDATEHVMAMGMRLSAAAAAAAGLVLSSSKTSPAMALQQKTSWPRTYACQQQQQLLLLSKVLLEGPRLWRYSRKRHGHGHAPVRLPSHWTIAIRKSRQFSSCLLSVKSGLWPTSSTSTAGGWWLWWQRYRASSNLDTSQAATRQAKEGQGWRLRLLRCQAHSSRSSPLRGVWH
jgi:hypothetical protein